VEAQVFRQVIGHFATGVTVITTREQGINYGLTASAVCSLTLEPPMLLVCINKNAGTQAAISRTRFFAVNILDEGQADLAYQSAKPQTDKFQGIEAQQRKVRRSLLNCSGQGEQWIATMKKKANGSALIASGDWEIRS
jgi:4-nitrophenol 2-monooxygenase / 4-nitrocatechol 4-monooxygenase, reductase component